MRDNIVIYDKEMKQWAFKVENQLKRDYILHVLKLNPYYIKVAIIKLLDKLGVKEFVKSILGR